MTKPRLVSIRVNPEYPWDSAQVCGKWFSKHQAIVLQEGDVGDEIMHSPILVIEPVEQPTESQPAIDVMPGKRERERTGR